MKYKNNVNGIILVNKPKGITSRDVVNKVEKLLQTKAGHTGTLDPMAEGVLAVCLGKATKLSDILTSKVKVYEAEVTLGIDTDTLDIEGKTLKEDFKEISQEQIENTLQSFIKTYKQEVPKYSAVKVNGKKLYEYARAGIDITLPQKEVTIYDLKLLNYSKKTFAFEAKVSKGTYIRSLIRDICASLNTIGTMSKLTRTCQGKFTLKNAYTLEDIEKGGYQILSIKDVLEVNVKKVDDDLKQKIINGVKLKSEGEILYLDKNDKELALYKDGKVWKMLYTK